MDKRTMATLAVASLLASASVAAWSAPKDIRWATGPVGSSGHKALVALASVLNKALPELLITVLPTPGAVTTVKGYATGDFDGYYGSDVALKELKAGAGRFADFKPHIKQQPIQSLWCYTLDIGLAIKASDRGSIRKWQDLSGMPVYTGPAPFDTRKHLENAMAAVGVHHIYKQVDLSTAGSQLNSGSIKAMSIYAAGGQTPPPWIAEATLAVDWAALNPSPDELAKLKAAGFSIIEVDPANFHKKELYVKQVTLLPFYWGFDLGRIVSADEMYKILTVIEAHADELAKLDPSFRQISGGRMAAFQKQALESTWDLVPIHPGLAKFMKARGVWDSKWDANVDKP
ncbi:MAG TPA: TAXI family TRAP transporter solute-binding subunit [Burkholderiales bacterium]|nr:TAXI family TRAP transporter solute-binding subunit [Burkholderiales bacterium]